MVNNVCVWFIFRFCYRTPGLYGLYSVHMEFCVLTQLIKCVSNIVFKLGKLGTFSSFITVHIRQ